jgi:predicted amidophosphoribosyltransferase
MKRVRRTKPQASLPAYERAANILGAFAVPRPERVAGRRVLLVDDVVTTMSTVNECARVLADAGVAEVRIAAVARGG